MSGMLSDAELKAALDTMRPKLLATCAQVDSVIDGVPGAKNNDPGDTVVEVHPEDGFVASSSSSGENPSLNPGFTIPITGSGHNPPRWRSFQVYLEAYGAADDQWAGYPTSSNPKFEGSVDVESNPGAGKYLAPLSGAACNRGQVKKVNLKLLDVNDLDIEEHSAHVDCQAYNQEIGPFTALLKSLIKDGKDKVSGLSPLAGIQGLLPAATQTAKDELQQLIDLLGSAEEIDSTKTLLDVPKKVWEHGIAQRRWTCYKFMKFQQVFLKKVPLVGSDDRDCFLVLFKMELTAGPKTETRGERRTPAGSDGR